VLVAACGRVDFAQRPPTTFLAVADGSNVNMFVLDTSAGGLKPTAQGAVESGDPNVIGTTPDGRFLYVPSFDHMSLAGYAIDPYEGTLTALPGMPIATGHLLQAASVVPSGRFLYVPTGEEPGAVLAYAIDPATGALAALGQYSAGGTGTYFPVINPTGTLLYLSSYEATCPGYRIDETIGALTMLPGFPIACQDSNLGATLDPSGRFLYVGSNTVDLRGYGIAADGTLTPVPGSPYSFKRATNWLAVDPIGGYLVVGVVTAAANSMPGLYVWARDRSTGAIALTTSSPYRVGDIDSLAFSPGGEFLYAATKNGTSDAVVQFAFDATTGALTQLASWRLDAEGISMVVVQPQLVAAE
jgi:6-phosphogluconolactonase